jgi:hypothetical protein
MLHGVVAIETHFSVKDHVPGDKHALLLVYDGSEQVPPVTFVLKKSKYYYLYNVKKKTCLGVLDRENTRAMAKYDYG